MSRLPRLLRTLHSSAVAPSASVAAPATAVASTSSTPAGPPVKFTPKGRPILGRPPRSTRVTLPSGYPEPAAYPPPAEYFAEIDAITTKPKAHPLWAFFHLPTGATDKPKEGAGMPDHGSLKRLDDEVVDLASGECGAERGARSATPGGTGRIGWDGRTISGMGSRAIAAGFLP